MKKNLILLVLWILIPPILLLWLHGNFFISSILYLVIPSIYFSIKKPSLTPRALTMALVSIAFVIILDFIAFLNNAWAVPTMFSFRFFKLIPLEDFFFTFWAVYVVISGFSYFFPQLSVPGMNRLRLKNFGIVIGFALTAFLWVYFFRQDLLQVPHYYTWLVSVLFILPTSLLLISCPKYRKPIIKTIFFSLCLMLPYEVVANMLGFWFFPSHEYLGMVQVLGQRFPIEEFLAWMIFFAPATLAFTKLITDDKTSDPQAFK